MQDRKDGDRPRPKPAGEGRQPADAQKPGFVDRVRAIGEGVRRQMAMRRQNRARPGGPVGGGHDL